MLNTYPDELTLKMIELMIVQVPSNFIAGRPEAALLFWFFGDFGCGMLYLRIFSLHINIKIGKNRC